LKPIYFLCWSFYRLAFSTYFRWKVFHPERVPLKGAVIIASNHASFLDPPLVGCCLKRDIHYLGRKSLFKVPAIAWFLRQINSVPLDRDGGGAAGLKTILERLALGAGILLFPEGTRTLDGNLQKARSGIGLAVIKTNAVVVPVRVFGTFEAWGKGRSIPRPHRVAAKFGKPISFEKLREESKVCDKARLKEIYQQVADEIMAAIAELKPGHDPE
jgi:1-acyl-sn-glycerol-3-phosphate acyltransferase